MKILFLILQITGSLILAVAVVSAFDADMKRWHRRNWLYAYSATVRTNKDEQNNWTRATFTQTDKLSQSSVMELEEKIKAYGEYDSIVITNIIYLGRVKPKRRISRER